MSTVNGLLSAALSQSLNSTTANSTITPGSSTQQDTTVSLFNTSINAGASSNATGNLPDNGSSQQNLLGSLIILLLSSWLNAFSSQSTITDPYALDSSDPTASLTDPYGLNDSSSLYPDLSSFSSGNIDASTLFDSSAYGDTSDGSNSG